MDIAEPKNKKILIEFFKLKDQIKYDIDTLKSKDKADIYRLRQINNVIRILKNYPDIIRSGDQLKDIKGIGKGTMARIDEILKNGFLSEIKSKHKVYEKNINELENVLGVGRKKAYELIKKHNIKSVNELKKAVKEDKIDVSHKIKLGIKYYEKYQERVPREEIDIINKYLKETIPRIDKDLIYMICGSYRRGKSTSHDIDVLLVHKKVKTKRQLQKLSPNYLHKVVDYLRKDKFLLDDIDLNYIVKYMGFCKCGKNPVRRIDIMYFPYDSYYPALLHLTGSGEFNRKMREVAKVLGYMLNQYGLYKVEEDDDKKRYIKIKVKSEKDIFDKLNMEYLEPDER